MKRQLPWIVSESMTLLPKIQKGKRGILISLLKVICEDMNFLICEEGRIYSILTVLTFSFQAI